MTTNEILKKLPLIKNRFGEKIKDIYIFGSTANYSRREFSDLDLMIITDLEGNDSLLFINDLYNEIKKELNIRSDIICSKSLNDLKSKCLNQNIFSNLIKV